MWQQQELEQPEEKQHQEEKQVEPLLKEKQDGQDGQDKNGDVATTQDLLPSRQDPITIRALPSPRQPFR